MDALNRRAVIFAAFVFAGGCSPSHGPLTPAAFVIARTAAAADGEAYVGGHVDRPGVYPVSAGRPVTLRQVLATAGADYQRPGGFKVEVARPRADGGEDRYELGPATFASATGDSPLQAGDQVFLVGVRVPGVSLVEPTDCFPATRGVVRLP